MRRLLVGLPLALVACQTVAPPVARRSVAPVVAATAAASPTPASTTAPAATLARPGTPSVALQARVAVDANYLVATGLGRIISHNGSNVVLTGDALVSDHGAGVVSNHGASRRVLAIAALTPAAGMRVQVVSLRTGRPLPLGLGADGQPAYATTTNDAGEVQVYLPQAEAGNVLVQAVVPNSRDARGRYEAVTANAAGAPAVIDEDTAQATAFLRTAFAGRIEALLTEDPAKVLCELGASDAYSAGVQAVLEQTVRELHDTASKAGITAGPAAQALASRMADTLIANADLGSIIVTPATYTGWSKQEPALAAITAVLGEVRDQASARLAQDPHFFDTRPYLVDGNACKPGTYQVARGADLNAFIVQEYLAAGSTGALTRMRTVIDDVDARHPGGLAEDQAIRMSAAATAVEGSLALAFVTDQGGAKSTALAEIAAYDPQATPAGPPRPQPCWHETADELKGCGAASPAP